LFLLISAPVFAQTTDAPPAMVPNSFANLAERVQDAVVNISTTQKIKVPKGLQGGLQTPNGQVVPMPQFPPGSPFQDFFEEFFNGQNGGPNGGMGGPGMEGMPGPAVQSLGSGFIIDGEKGLVVTNNHVIEDADEIQVILHDDTKLQAKVIGHDKATDLAILKVISPKKLKSVSWGDSDTMRVGDWILAVGNPFGLGGTVTSGIISARQRNINAGSYDDFIQTDASINRGNSGGPMFNMQGQVIGINTAIFSPTGGSVGIGFAIPSNLAKPVIDQLTQFGETHRGWIGVRIQEITPEIAESLNLASGKGALVASATPGGPADKAGLKQGDIILSFAGKDISAMRLLPRVVADTPVGKNVPVKILRQGKEMTLEISPGEMEKARKSGLLDDESDTDKTETAQQLKDTDIKPLHLRVAALTDELRQRFQLGPEINGVIVTDVNRQSDAALKGISPGDVILEINQRVVKNPGEVATVLKDAEAAKKASVLLLVNSQNNLRFVAVKLTGDEKKPEKPAEEDRSDDRNDGGAE
ncbi:MAG: degP2, partial [Alphaproteobacteria bacterium]|nr:degP2 [Alphaproteobacteria bacterium]